MAEDVGMNPEKFARRLETEPESVAENSTDATLKDVVWTALNEAADRLDPPPEDGAAD